MLTTRYIALLAIPAAFTVLPAQESRDTTPTINAATDPLLRGFRWRSIGPVGQGGRVDDFAVDERNPSTYYVGFATAGIWKTTNNGVTFTPIFDTYTTHSIGDIALAPSNPDIIYVGTGEANNRQSSSFGDGMYKSTDGGKTFAHIGLRETQSIARVVVHPTNPDIVWVAAAGHLFGPNAERGVFKSENGGRSWTKTLSIDANTGATDLVIHPKNPDILFAAMYARRRASFGFASGSPQSGMYKSTNGGRSWTRVTGGGLPAGTMGRVALDISRSNPNVMYAQIEVAPDKEPAMVAQAGNQGGGGGAGGGGGRNDDDDERPDPAISGVWRSADGGATWTFQSNQNVRPMYFSQLRVDPNNENTVYVGGVDAYKSTDGGKTWREMDNHGHVDHHAIWIDPNNSNHVMYGNDGSVDVSYDGGMHWQSLRTWAVGQPYHASADMRRPYYVCTGLQDNGSWCGPSSVRSGGILPQDWYRVGGGDGFYTQNDPTDHLLLYSESQNGNISRVDLRNGTSQNIRPRGTATGGRGGGGGGGGGGQARSNVVPAPDTSVRFRFNWNSPMLLSPHDPSTIYYGGNRFFRSNDRGATWAMSADLTKGIDRDDRELLGKKLSLPTCSRQRRGDCVLSRNDGVTYYGTITTIAESRVHPGVIWVGTDDGNVQVSRDGGVTFTEVGSKIPGGTKEYYVSRVEASHFDAATAYVSVDGHRSDDLRPYVYVTRDFGATWTPIANNLPATGNVNTIRQDLRNPTLLYAGTEFGFYVSLDEGRSWKPFMTNLPVVRIDEVLVHPRDNDLVLATHGRSVQIMDDITPLQQMTPAVLARDAHLFEPRNAVRWKNDLRQRRAVTGQMNWEGANAPEGTSLAYHLKSAPSGDVTITIREVGDTAVFRRITGTKLAGLNQVRWDLCSDLRPAPQQGGFGGGGGGGCSEGQGRNRRVGRMAEPGSYSVTLRVGGREFTRSVTVLEDIWMNP